LEIILEELFKFFLVKLKEVIFRENLKEENMKLLTPQNGPDKLTRTIWKTAKGQYL
jgi:hypothetical protein